VRLYQRPCGVCNVVPVLLARHLRKPPILVSIIILYIY
jgi:hypothetical protein